MNLPSLDLQLVYGPLAWGLVLAACGVAVLTRKRPFPARLAVAWVVIAFAACAWPGPRSPAYWLALVFQFPSAALVAFCAITIHANATGRAGLRALPAGLAMALAGGGALLYLDSAGWLNLGLYAHGFGTPAALAGLLIGVATVVSIARGRQRMPAFAILLAVTLFALARLPTGNLWDALIDPLLWLWAIFSLLARAAARRPAGAPSPQPS